MSSKDFNQLTSFLSDSQIITDPKSLEIYGRDWVQFYPSNPSIVIFPKTTKEVARLVEWAKTYKKSLVPSGGRTGLSGGATATNKEVIVSFEKMNRLIEFNEFEATLTVEPGMITKEVQKAAEERGFFMPISFAAEGSSQIGGNVATNAGGIHVIHYGLMRRWVQSLEVVTGNGDVLHLGRGLIKDATGYNLLHLFIGSEGTLGFITKITLSLTKPPSSLNVLLLAVENLDHLMKIYSQFKKEIPLHAFEMLTQKALEYVEKSGNHSSPLSEKTPYYVLMEIFEKDQEKALSLFEKLMNEGNIKDGAISQNHEQAQKIWALRENISESISAHHPYKNDISVRISHLPKFLNQMDPLLKEKYPGYDVIWFGHVGDGNLHINILKPPNEDPQKFVQACQNVNQILFSKIQEFKGSISAEHGVGLLKKDYLHFSKSQEEIMYIQKIKKIFDPEGIMNPGKIIPFSKTWIS